MKRFFLTLCTLLITTTLWAAAAETINGVTWNYRVIDGQAEIQKGSNKSAIPSSTTGAITIPSTLGGYPVTSIGNYAFSGCYSLTSVTIPSSVTTIGDFAFSYCESLTSVTIPSSVTEIGDYAFECCSSLTSVTIPSSVTEIGDYAFDFCSSLTSVTIPRGVSTIGERAFSYCESLTSVTILEGVTTIGVAAFEYCSSLTSVTIPSSVTSIGERAFYYCYSLRSVYFEGMPPSVDSNAFDDFSATGYYSPKHASAWASVIDFEGKWDGLVMTMGRLTYRVPIPHPAATFTATAVGEEQVTLKVTAQKGYVFAGWYTDDTFTKACDSFLADYRNPTYTYNIAPDNLNFNALFVTAEEDTLLDLVGTEAIPTKGSDQRAIQLVIDSYSLPKVSATGLPAGMKFTATPVMVKGSKTEVEYPANTIYGTPTKPGIYTVKVALTNTTITKAITKTFNIEVPNLKAPGVIDVYDYYGEYVPGVSYIEEVPEAEGCAVTGLPAGMKWTAKDIIDLKTKEVTVPANSVYGVPTTPGNYTVYFTKTVDKVKYTATAIFKVGPYPQLNVMVSDGGVGGKVTGTGGFAANKTATLRATPNKGYVFAGWYKDALFETPCDSTLVDYRNPSYTYVMGDCDTQFYARFVTKEEDNWLELKVNDEEIWNETGFGDILTFKVFGESEFNFTLGSKSLPKATVTGLPTGMKFTATPVMVKGAKTEVEYPINTIYGTPTKPGIYTVKVALTNTTITKAITKTFNIEVPNLKAPGVIDVYDCYGEYVPGVSYIEEVPEAEGCAVTGLPVGMKWTAKDIIDLKTKEVTVPANSVYGVPTTPGNYTVYFTKTVDKVKYTATATFAVGPYPQLTVEVPVCTDGTIGGKVTGAGGFAANKTATLRATPNKGYVFAGWYKDALFETPCDSTLVDYRNPSYTYVMGATNKTFYARFVPADEDLLLTLTVKGKEITDGSRTFMVDGPSVLTFDVGSNSLPKISVKGLPAGMKFTDKPVMKKGAKTEVEYPANSIYGTPTKPGIYTVTVSLTNTTVKKAITKTFEIEVPNLTAANEYFNVTLQNGSGDACQLVAGDANVSSLPSLTLRDPNCKLAVSGLPAGLKYDAKTGQIVGVPTKTGTFTVTLTVTVGKQKFVSTITIKVTTLPSWAIGTFGGELENQWLEDDGPAYAYGDAYLEIDDEGYVFGQIELWDDYSYTYCDIATKATIKILADGCRLLKIPADIYTEMIDEGYTYHEGRYTLEATIDKTGYLSLDYGRRDYGEFLHGDLFQWGDSLPSWVTGTYSCDYLENGWWCDDCDQMEYAFGDGWFEIDAVGNVLGKINLWDDSSYTYADVDAKAAVKLKDDGTYSLKFSVNVYTKHHDGRTEYEGRFILEVIVNDEGKLLLDYRDPRDYVIGTFRK